MDMPKDMNGLCGSKEKYEMPRVTRQEAIVRGLNVKGVTDDERAEAFNSDEAPKIIKRMFSDPELLNNDAIDNMSPEKVRHWLKVLKNVKV